MKTTKEIIGEAIQISSHLWGLTKEEATGVRRLRRNSDCRACIYYAIRLCAPQITYKQIGDFILRDHSCMTNQLQKVYQVERTDRKLLTERELLLLSHAQATKDLLTKFITSK